MESTVSTAPELAELVARLADNKYYLGLRYAEWCTAAPTLESAVAAASMAQTEIGHARSLYPLLQDIAGVSPETEAETRTQFVHARFLRQPFEGWTDFVAANFLFDTALTIVLEASQKSKLTDLASRARRMLEEEPLHWLHGEGWTRRLAGRGNAVRAALLSSFDGVIADALEWFDVAREPLIRDGILDAASDELRHRFRSRINPVLESTDLPRQ
jgi:phenylacetate-CoA oxygenase PaaI subunit